MFVGAAKLLYMHTSITVESLYKQWNRASFFFGWYMKLLINWIFSLLKVTIQVLFWKKLFYIGNYAVVLWSPFKLSQQNVKLWFATNHFGMLNMVLLPIFDSCFFFSLFFFPGFQRRLKGLPKWRITWAGNTFSNQSSY